MYLPVEKADTLIPMYAPSIAQTWQNYTLDEKGALIELATLKIDELPFSGRALQHDGHRFPRYIGGREITGDNIRVQMAMVYIIEHIINVQRSNEYSMRIQKLKALGVSSMSVGGSSLSFNNEKSSTVPTDAMAILSPYMGGFSIY